VKGVKQQKGAEDDEAHDQKAGDDDPDEDDGPENLGDGAPLVKSFTGV
jgi:hypothetical protein